MNLKGEAPFYFGEVDFNNAIILKDMGYVTVFRSFFTGSENVVFLSQFSRRKKKESLRFFQESYNRAADERHRELIVFEKFAFNTAAKFWGDPNGGPAREFFDKVLKIRENWAAMDNNAIPEASQKHLVQPILEMCSKNPLYYAHQVGFALTDASATYANLHRMTTIAREQFEGKAEYLRLLAKEVYVAKAKLRKFRIKKS